MSKLNNILNKEDNQPEFKIEIYNKDFIIDDEHSNLYLNNETCPKRIKNFLEDIVLLSKKYNLTISHEDDHGAFVIEEYDKINLDWLHRCNINIKDE